MPLDTWAKCVGAVLLAFREQERNLTRHDAVRAARTSEDTFDWKTARSIERGYAGVSNKKIEQYARGLGIDPSELFAIASAILESGQLHRLKPEDKVGAH